MLLHEHQAKSLLRANGIALLPGDIAHSADEAVRIHESLGVPKVVVKAQILAGGRGKAGGVKLSGSAQQTQSIARELLGKTLITVQTGAAGEKANAVYIEAACEIDREFYFAITIDRTLQCPVILFSAQGGVEIESVPHEKILTVQIDPPCGFSASQVRKISPALELADEQSAKLAALAGKMFDFFFAHHTAGSDVRSLSSGSAPGATRSRCHL